MFRLLTAALVAAFFFAFPVQAGGSKHHFEKNETNIINSPSSAAESAARASTGSIFAFGFSGGSVGGTTTTAGCRVGYSKNYGGLYAYSDARRDKRCRAFQDMAVACERETRHGPRFDAEKCDQIRRDILDGKFNDDYVAPEPEVVLSQEPECKPDEHGVIPAFCPGGLFGPDK